jgi:hypothetical protein
MMPTHDYSSKEALENAIHTAYLALDQEFEGMENAQKDIRLEGVDRTPAPNYKWNQLGGLYQSFYLKMRFLIEKGGSFKKRHYYNQFNYIIGCIKYYHLYRGKQPFEIHC